MIKSSQHDCDTAYNYIHMSLQWVIYISCTLATYSHTIPIIKDSRMVSPPRNTLCGLVEI